MLSFRRYLLVVGWCDAVLLAARCLTLTGLAGRLLSDVSTQQQQQFCFKKNTTRSTHNNNDMIPSSAVVLPIWSLLFRPPPTISYPPIPLHTNLPILYNHPPFICHFPCQLYASIRPLLLIHVTSSHHFIPTLQISFIPI
ncbi:hypothetical protein ABW19_dt0200781 [Dactylella cylindrospora]|nr:hypothetical protein ABW19_dt0200781 [Dactylella cylindrospora]